MLRPPALGPERRLGTAELATKLELKPACLTSDAGSEAFQEHLVGLGRRKGGEEECRNMRNAGLQETEAGQVLQTIEEEGRWPLTFLAWVGLGPGSGRLDFIKLESSPSLSMSDGRPEVS